MATTTTPTKTTGAKKTTKKTTGSTARKKTTKKTAARRAPARKAPETTTPANAPAGRTNPSPTPLFERSPGAVLETAGYAAAGLAHDAVALARALPSRFETLVDRKAADGKQVVDGVVTDERVSRILDQTSSTRSQLKAAVTSVTKIATNATTAARDQARTAGSKIKAAATSVRKSTLSVTDAVSDTGS